jgi:hypothetical protein
MATRVEILGVHPIDADELCHLIELLVHEANGEFDFGAITQEVPGQPRSNWQVPWDEVALDANGASAVANPDWIGDVRVAFFFHYLDPHRPLITPFGEALIPAETSQPSRLAFLEYQPP